MTLPMRVGWRDLPDVSLNFLLPGGSRMAAKVCLPTFDPCWQTCTGSTRGETIGVLGTRAITCRVFPRVEDTRAHHRVGNLPPAINVMTYWLETCRAE